MERTPEELEMISRAQEVTDNHTVVLEASDVRWKQNKMSAQLRGFGYITQSGTKALIKCPACQRENYAFNVSSGLCTWCPFDANKKPGEVYE